LVPRNRLVQVNEYSRANALYKLTYRAILIACSLSIWRPPEVQQRRKPMRRLMFRLATVSALAAGAMMIGGRAQAAALPGADGLTAAIDTSALTENVQYFYGGRNYCWYEGWNGPGWYWCGYGARRGYGWGGGYGYRGWGGGRGGGGRVIVRGGGGGGRAFVGGGGGGRTVIRQGGGGGAGRAAVRGGGGGGRGGGQGRR
jgi:hypothetical protein